MAVSMASRQACSIGLKQSQTGTKTSAGFANCVWQKHHERQAKEKQVYGFSLFI
jgi:hypothetical protein